MVYGSSVNQSIFHKADVEQLENYTQSKYSISYFTEDNLMKFGEVRITPDFDLGIDILFVQDPKEYDYQIAKSLLLNTYRNLIDTPILKVIKISYVLVWKQEVIVFNIKMLHL